MSVEGIKTFLENLTVNKFTSTICAKCDKECHLNRTDTCPQKWLLEECEQEELMQEVPWSKEQTLPCNTCRSAIHLNCVYCANDEDKSNEDIVNTTLSKEKLHFYCNKNVKEKCSKVKKSTKTIQKKSRQRQKQVKLQQEEQEEKYRAMMSSSFCSLECELQIELFVNPQFSQMLSTQIEKECIEKWERFLSQSTLEQELTVSKNHNTHDNNSTFRNSCSHLQETIEQCAKMNAFPFTHIADHRIRLWLIALYVQIRHDGWYNYFAREFRFHSHPLYVMPSYVDIDDEYSEFINNLITPREQANRLYLLHPSKHPIGSVLALPSDKIWNSTSLYKCNETNNYVAESLHYLMTNSVDVVKSKSRSDTNN